jgi:alpha-L-fucosidase
LEKVGAWLRRCGGEAIYDTEPFVFHLEERSDQRDGNRGDFNLHGPVTAKRNTLYWLVRRWSGSELTLGGLQCSVKQVTLLGDHEQKVQFKQDGTRVTLRGLPEKTPDPVCPVIRIECDGVPELYQTGGLRVPKVSHPHYDPCPSDIKH